MRLHTWSEPLERDVTLYAVLGHELLAGRELYSDLWDHKPPAIFAAYAAGELLAGYGRNAIYLINVGAAVATLLGIWSAARRLAGDSAAVSAALMWTIICGDPRLQANQPNTEVFMNALLVWAFRLLLDAETRRYAALGAGVLFALATLFKHVAVFPAVAIVLMTRRVRALAIVGVTGLVAWLAVFSYFAMSDRREEFIAAVFLSNISYSGSFAANVVEGLRQLFGPSPRVLVPLMLSALLALRFARPQMPLLGAWCAGTFLAVAAPGRFHAHYYQLWLPPLVIAFGVLAARALVHRRATIAIALTLLAFAFYEGAFYRHDAARWSRFKYGDIFSNATDAARSLPPARSIYVWGDEPAFHFETRLSPITGVLQREHLSLGSHAPKLVARVLADLERNPPELVIVNEQVRSDHDVLRWIDARYARMPIEAPAPFAYYAPR